MPDAKAVNPEVLRVLQANVAGDPALADRAKDNKASRDDDRGDVTKEKVSADQDASNVWRLPLEEYSFTSPYGVRWGKLHAGIDLAAAEGVPYKAVHAGTVTQAGYNGGYGYSVTIKDASGVEVVYAHSRRVFPQVGDEIKAGQVIGEVGSTGASFGTHLHIEVHVEGQPTDPIPFLRDRGVDIKLQVESVYRRY
jgi:murein DD-endopeptidase MepM/ murein hydrolase activator NlpD